MMEVLAPRLGYLPQVAEQALEHFGVSSLSLSLSLDERKRN